MLCSDAAVRESSLSDMYGHSCTQYCCEQLNSCHLYRSLRRDVLMTLLQILRYEYTISRNALCTRRDVCLFIASVEYSYVALLRHEVVAATAVLMPLHH
jgi:hypothetical protein